MSKFCLIFCLILINFHSFGRELSNFNQFLIILGKLESNNNDFAVGDNGKSISRYQIQLKCYQDATNFNKSIQFSYNSLTNRANAEIVVKAYISRYSKNNSFEEWARLWNGGPAWKKATGQKKKNLDIYWKKFEKILAKEKLKF